MRFIYTKAFGIFFACLLGLTILVFMQVRGWLDPIRMAFLNSPRPVIFLVKSVTLPVKTFFSTIYQLDKISKENANLQDKIHKLEQDLVLKDQESRENEALRKELGFIKTSKQQYIPCSVLSQNFLGAKDALVLNCGIEDGVEEGLGIVSQGYLVGKITYAGKETSTVLLAVSSQFSTDAKVSQTSATAIVEGSYGSGLVVNQVPQTTELKPGWLVVTAGINEKIPKNILIGEVSSMLSSGNDLFKKAALTSPLDFKNLEFVFAVKQ